MEGALASWIASLLSGAVGGNIAGALLKNKSLGVALNSIVGILGGGIGGQLVGQMLGGGMLGNIGSSAVGGAILLWLISLFKKVT